MKDGLEYRVLYIVTISLSIDKDITVTVDSCLYKEEIKLEVDQSIDTN